MEAELKEVFIKMFGEEAYKNDGKISNNTIRMFQAIRYYDTQLQITKRWCDDEGKGHIEEVKKAALRILTREEV